ncbi:MAG: ppnK [Chlamydiales bacterium]|jgi:NAD+ kinase|nr:ppnK [Chlamydiales bacterium]
MIIALFPNPEKIAALHIAKEIAAFLSDKKITIVADEEHAGELNAATIRSVPKERISFRISLGGDGTILRMVHCYPEIDAPILGINQGSLGFMADIKISEIFTALESLLSGNYQVQQRLMMEGVNVETQQRGFAVNEIVTHRASIPSLIDLSIHVDEQYLNTFSADGIIVATPNGSTAYSLAAGGPILTPELDAFVITPISPHTISNRPIVLSPQKKIDLKYLSAYAPVEISFDGLFNIPLKKGETLRITCSKKRFPLVSFPNHDFFHTLRSKLGWSGKLR